MAPLRVMLPLDKMLRLLVAEDVVRAGNVRLPAMTKLILSAPVPCVKELSVDAPTAPMLIGTIIWLSPLVIVRATDENVD